MCTNAERNMPEASRTYSSVWSGNAIGTGHARSMLDSQQAWSAQTNRAGEWMQIDLGTVHTVTGVTTQGRAASQWDNQYITGYTVKTSVDGFIFTDVPGTYSGQQGDEHKAAIFPSAVRARYVKLVVVSWNAHCSMRAGVILGSGECDAKPEPECTNSEDNMPEASRTYSSVWNSDATGSGHARSTLDSAQAWSAQTNQAGEWMMIDLGTVHTVTGVTTQGRAASQWDNQYVTSFTVK